MIVHEQRRGCQSLLPSPTEDTCCSLTHGCNVGVYFGQLLGMADHLSFTLGRAGYRIHKIVPYGPVHETLQYLIRYASARIAFCLQNMQAMPSSCVRQALSESIGCTTARAAVTASAHRQSVRSLHTVASLSHHQQKVHDLRVDAVCRRAQENSSIMSATGKEREMIQAELVRRLHESLSLNRLFKAPGDMQQQSASAAA